MNFASSDWNIGLSLLLCKSGAYSTFISLTQTVVTFAIDGPVCNALVKLIGPRYTLSATFLGVAVTILGMGFATNRAEWFALRLCEWSRGRPLQCRGRLGQYRRAVLGLFEGGIFPCGVFVMTTWYAPSQLAFRLSVFYMGGTL